MLLVHRSGDREADGREGHREGIVDESQSKGESTVESI